MSTVNMPASNSGLVGSNPTEATNPQPEGVKKWKLFGPSTSTLRKWLSKFQKKSTPVPIYEEIVEMSHKYLKIKIKSLAAEATMIRQEENKTKANYRRLKGMQGKEQAYESEVATFWGLRHHRTCDVRDEARAAQLAYAYVRGKPFKYVENNTWAADWSKSANKPILVNQELQALAGRVARLATKYGPKDVSADEIEKWYVDGFTQEDAKRQWEAFWEAFYAHERKVRARADARAAKAKAA